MKILVSAGEASGDRYAADLVARLHAQLPEAEFFGCAGPRLREQGVRAVVRSESLAVVGLLEVVRHIPRIWGEFRKLVASAKREKPDLAILTDSPDFNLRVAAKLKALGVPVVYYVAPQVWAWRSWRVNRIRRVVDKLLCIFPFEEPWFNERGVPTRYVGHPLADQLEQGGDRKRFLAQLGLDPSKATLAVLPGSRKGEAARHMPVLLDAVDRLLEERDLNVVLPASSTTGEGFFAPFIGARPIIVAENEARGALQAADVALIASGTASTEAALLGAPMAVFYRVTAPTWLLGKLLVDLPHYSMVNLLADREIVPELIQDECTGERLAAEVRRILDNEETRATMKRDLAEIRQTLQRSEPAAEIAAEEVCKTLGITGTGL